MSKADDRVKRLRGLDVPRRRRVSLSDAGGSVRAVVDRDAVRAAGHDLDDPGETTQFVFEEHGLVVLDLTNNVDGAAIVADGAAGDETVIQLDSDTANP